MKNDISTDYFLEQIFFPFFRKQKQQEEKEKKRSINEIDFISYHKMEHFFFF